jgi:predicted ATPase
VAERPTFVAREGELERLDRFLDRALAGQGLVCFVTGEAGSGKTALLGQSAQRAQERHRDLVVAIGQGDAQTGRAIPTFPSARCWVSLICYRVLLAVGDPLAPEILAAAHALLQERAARIDDENLRRSFMESMPSHREITRAFATG